MPADETRQVVAHRAATAEEARAALAVLDSHGIEASWDDERAQELFAGTLGPTNPLEILVAESDLERTRDILAEELPRRPDSGRLPTIVPDVAPPGAEADVEVANFSRRALAAAILGFFIPFAGFAGVFLGFGVLAAPNASELGAERQAVVAVIMGTLSIFAWLALGVVAYYRLAA